MKHIFKILLVLIILIIFIFILLFNINNKNNKYLDSISKDILNNYKIDEEITYSNLYGNYYIFTTDTKVIVLNKEYEEIEKVDIDILDSTENNYELIYKNNKLMYEETILEKDTLTYKYYDATNNELIKETSIKGEVK